MKLTPAKIRAAWKPELRTRRFRLEHSLFMRDYGPLRQVIGVQRNYLLPAWKTNPSIGILDSFWKEPKLRVYLSGNIGSGGARFFEDEGSGRAEDRFSEKLRAVLECGILSLDSFAGPVTLIDLFEKAVDQCTHVERFFERGRNDGKPRPAWLKTIHVAPSTPPRPAPLYFDLLTLLHHAAGNLEKGCDRGQIGLGLVRSMKIPESPNELWAFSRPCGVNPRG
jgi:hypothetical protein